MPLVVVATSIARRTALKKRTLTRSTAHPAARQMVRWWSAAASQLLRAHAIVDDSDCTDAVKSEDTAQDVSGESCASGTTSDGSTRTMGRFSLDFCPPKRALRMWVSSDANGPMHCWGAFARPVLEGSG